MLIYMHHNYIYIYIQTCVCVCLQSMSVRVADVWVFADAGSQYFFADTLERFHKLV